MKKFSVILLTYNSSERDLKLTLDSVLQQSMKDYEIIVADDGSKVKNEEYLIGYFKAHDFFEYRILLNVVNQGTVKNYLAAVEIADSEYIKGIGAGDLLYDKNTLEKVYFNMSNNNSKILFGNTVAYYFLDNDKIEYKNMKSPLYKNCYKNYNSIKIKKNMLLYDDFIIGACLFEEREFLKRNLRKLAGAVTYCEDFVRDLAVMEGERIKYIDEYLVFYQYYTGVSTRKKSSSGEKVEIKPERKIFMSYLHKQYPQDKVIRAGLYFIKADEIGLRLLRILCKLRWAPRYPLDFCKAKKRLEPVKNYNGIGIDCGKQTGN